LDVENVLARDRTVLYLLSREIVANVLEVSRHVEGDRLGELLLQADLVRNRLLRPQVGIPERRRNICRVLELRIEIHRAELRHLSEVPVREVDDASCRDRERYADSRQHDGLRARFRGDDVFAGLIQRVQKVGDVPPIWDEML